MELHIRQCVHESPTSPQLNSPLRINVSGPLSAIEKLLPHIHWRLSIRNQHDQQPAGAALAQLTFRTIFGQEPPPESEDIMAMVVQDEQFGSLNDLPPGEVIYRGRNKLIDCYGVTFAHSIIPKDCENPGVLQIIISETEQDGAAIANSALKTPINPKDYVPYKPRVFAAYRYCHIRPYDTLRTNQGVQKWHKERQKKTGRFLSLA